MIENLESYIELDWGARPLAQSDIVEKINEIIEEVNRLSEEKCVCESCEDWRAHQ